MHILYFTTLPKEEADTSTEACEQVSNILESNNFTNDNSGYWGSSKGDWFVIGGRWSGELTRHKIGKEKIQQGLEKIKPFLLEELKKSPDILEYLNINEHLIAEKGRIEKMKAIDEAYASVTGSPYFRTSYLIRGYEDDAMILSQEILTSLRSTKFTDTEIAVTIDGYIEDELPFTQWLERAQEHIGKVWLVVVDYHI